MKNFVTAQPVFLLWCEIIEDKMGWACDLDGKGKNIRSISQKQPGTHQFVGPKYRWRITLKYILG
jgi:hypothetical protein